MRSLVGFQRLNMHMLRSLVVAGCFCFSSLVSADVKGVIQANISHSDGEKFWHQSWLDNGTGVTRFDHSLNGLNLDHIALEADFKLTDDMSLFATGIYYGDQSTKLGISEAYVQYKPLSSGWQSTWRVGAFYPNMSFENPDTAWNSPYTYSYSAINSWIAEELRIIGAEWAYKRPGRKYKSPHSFTFVASIFANNDPLGTMLSWRGWALHNRQTLLGERVEFANYPSLNTVLAAQPSWVEPFEEIDDTIGGYVGAHWQYKNKHKVRVYYYNNFADEKQRTGELGQYAWQTYFTSIAWQYRIDKTKRILTQWMQGNTIMGKPSVDVDFTAWYVMYSQQFKQHRFSIRYDNFETIDRDHYTVQDPNDSDGNAMTIAWRYDLNKSYQIGLEYLDVSSTNINRQQWNWQPRLDQKQWQAVVQYKF